MATASISEHAPSALANVISLDEIELTVLPNMRLAIYPQEIARAGEHNSAVFRIISQPQQLDGLPCRAEIKTADGSTFHVLVTNGAFALTNDITKHGVGTIQLVYSDGTVSHKTQQQQYWVAPSINAVTESDPEYQDGLAQIVAAAFTGAGTLGTQLIFTNFAGHEVARVTFPGAGLDEATANTLYLRLDGNNHMSNNIVIDGPNRGVIFGAGTGNGVIYYDGLGMFLRRAAGNAEWMVEDNNGNPASRSPIVTLFSGDQRYATITYVDGRFLSIDGGQIVGPIRQLAAEAPATAETLVTRGYVDSIAGGGGITEGEADLRYLQLSGGTMVGNISFASGHSLTFQPNYSAIQEQGGTLSARHGAGQFSAIMTLSDSDSRYLQLANGGQINGVLSMGTGAPIISAMGTGSNPMLCIGSNDSGWWRTGGNIIFEVGRTLTWLYSAIATTCYTPLTLTAGAPTQNNHAATKAYVDGLALAPSLVSTMPASFTLTSDFQAIVFRTYPIPRGGNSRVMVTVGGGVSYSAAAQLGMIQVRITPGGMLHNQFIYSVQDGPSNVEGSSLTLGFAVDVTGTAPQIQVEIRTVGTPPPGLSLIGGSTDPRRTLVTFADMGPRTAAGETEEQA